MCKSKTYRLFIWISLILSLGFLDRISPILVNPENISVDDFGHFWASGRQFLNSTNPYDAEQLVILQEQAGGIGFDTRIPSLTLTPPWSLLIFAPFSILNYQFARLAWLYVNIAIIIFATQQLWILYHGSKNRMWLALLAIFTFAPTISVLMKGQVTIWLLIGLVGFLLFTEGKLNEWIGCASLLLLAIKPQLFYLFWPAIGLWLIQTRQWGILLKSVVIITGVFLVLLIPNPLLFSQYIYAMKTYPASEWATPTIGAYLRLFAFGINNFWVQYIPAIFTIFWLIVHYLKTFQTWNWRKEIPTLLFLSLLTSPYAWTYDQVLLLPAILIATNHLSRQFSGPIIFFWLVYITINLLDMLLHMRLDEFWFIWLAPAYLLWYIGIAFWDKKNNLVPNQD
jgi:hypothetical protein